jgi:hypothetical protein
MVYRFLLEGVVLYIRLDFLKIKESIFLKNPKNLSTKLGSFFLIPKISHKINQTTKLNIYSNESLKVI